jgi:hypothetical protein
VGKWNDNGGGVRRRGGGMMRGECKRNRQMGGELICSTANPNSDFAFFDHFGCAEAPPMQNPSRQ